MVEDGEDSEAEEADSAETDAEASVEVQGEDSEAEDRVDFQEARVGADLHLVADFQLAEDLTAEKPEDHTSRLQDWLTTARKTSRDNHFVLQLAYRLR